MPQIFWHLDQAVLKTGRQVTPSESDQIVSEFLRQQPVKFSAHTIQQVAYKARYRIHDVSLDESLQQATPPQERSFWGEQNGHQEDVEQREEYELLLSKIHTAIADAGFTMREQAIILQKLELSFDQQLYERIETEFSAGSLRNRKSQLMVRFLAAIHAKDSLRFGRFLRAEPRASQSQLINAIADWSRDHGLTMDQSTSRLLNCMSLSERAYRVTISERGRLESYLVSAGTIGGPLHNKLKAALIDQDRQGSPCLRCD